MKVSVKLAMKKAQKAWSKSEKVSHKKGLSNHLDLKDQAKAHFGKSAMDMIREMESQRKFSGESGSPSNKLSGYEEFM